MTNLEAFVSIGTGGMVNAPPAFPIFPVGTGATGGVAGSVQTGVPYGLQPGQATAGVPTGWLGGFSGVIGGLGAWMSGVQRTATGSYALGLQDDWVRMDSCDVTTYGGATGGTGVDCTVIDFTVGRGNTIATGGFTGWLGPGNNPKNMIFLQFTSTTSGLPVDLGNGAGFSVDIRVRDSQAGPQ
jgi:hypothetical protein